MIKFWKTTDEYGYLSNFSNHPVEIDGKIWKTTEHYYQAMKFLDEESQEKVRAAKSPKQSKEVAYSLEGFREDWEDVKYGIMIKALREKAGQYDFIEAMLIDSGSEELAEDSPYDPVWGLGKDGTGQNLLGKAWMQIRSEVADDAKSSYKTVRIRAEYQNQIEEALQEAEDNGYAIKSIFPIVYTEKKLGQILTTTDILIITRKRL